MVSMAKWTEIRHRREVRVAFFNGKPVASEDYETVRKLLDGVHWYRPVAIFCGAAACFWSYLAVIGQGHLGWVADLYVFSLGIMTLTLLWQRKRILNGASKMNRDA
jgi:hypothetical protein